MSDNILRAYYGEYPRINKRTPVDITSRVEADHFASLFEAIEDDCNIEPYGYKIGDCFESHNSHTVTQDLGTSGTESNTVKFRYWLAHPDLYYGGFDLNAVVSKHHLAIVVDFRTKKRWNDGTLTGYENSRIQQWLIGSEALGNVKKDLSYILTGSEGDGSFGDNCLLKNKRLYPRYRNSVFDWSWPETNQSISSLTEVNVCGASIMSRKEADQTNYQQGDGVNQLEIFRKYSPNFIMGPENEMWLRSMVDASRAVRIHSVGIISIDSYSASHGVFGLILLANNVGS